MKIFKRSLFRNREDVLVSVAVMILFVTTLTDWTFQSWLVLVAVILILIGWYYRKED